MKYKAMKRTFVLSTALSFVISPYAFSAEKKKSDDKSPTTSLVSPDSIAEQKQLTKIVKLKNGIPVIVRQVKDSDIIHVSLTIAHGIKDLPTGSKTIAEWYWNTATMGAKNYPKEKLFATLEKYAIQLDCSAGIEFSSCSLGTVNEYWDKALPILEAVLKDPDLTAEDSKLTKDRLLARYRAIPTNPGEYINEVINSVYYPPSHPYRLTSHEALNELDKLDRKDLLAYQQQIANANRLALVVVSSLPEKQLTKQLNRAFGTMKAKDTKDTIVKPPVFKEKQAYAFETRDIPTAYMRAKFNTPGITDRDAVAMKLLFEILSEKLGEEIRTKRSLSYAVFAFNIQYSTGIGVLSASTSKPQETLSVMSQVVQDLRNKKLSEEEVEEYKHVFATGYFLTQETHAALAGALANTYFYFKTPDPLYDAPALLDQVKPADIQRLAKLYLKNFSMGVIFDRGDFQDEWARSFIKKSIVSEDDKKKETH